MLVTLGTLWLAGLGQRDPAKVASVLPPATQRTPPAPAVVPSRVPTRPIPEWPSRLVSPLRTGPPSRQPLLFRRQRFS